MKSSCGSYGAQLSYQQVVALEQACKHEDGEQVARLLAELEQSLPQVLPPRQLSLSPCSRRIGAGLAILYLPISVD